MFSVPNRGWLKPLAFRRKKVGPKARQSLRQEQMTSLSVHFCGQPSQVEAICFLNVIWLVRASESLVLQVRVVQ